MNNFDTTLKNRSGLFSCSYEFKASTLGSIMTLFKVYPEIGVGVYRTPENFGKSIKWHSAMFGRPGKDLSNKILQIDCSCEENCI